MQLLLVNAPHKLPKSIPIQRRDDKDVPKAADKQQPYLELDSLWLGHP